MEEVPREELTADEMNSPISIVYRACAYCMQVWEEDDLDILVCMVVCTTLADFLYKGMGHHGRPSRFRQ